MTLKPGRTMLTAPDESRAHPRVDWEFLLGDTEAKVALLRQRLAGVEARPWVEQVDIRDRVADLNREILSLLSQV